MARRRRTGDRELDWQVVGDLLRHELVRPGALRDRLDRLGLPEAQRRQLLDILESRLGD